MTLRAFIIADPVLAVAELVQSQCQRLARHCLVAVTGEQLAVLAHAHRPEVIIYSLELTHPAQAEAIPKLIKALPESLIIASYRELSVRHMQSVEYLGIKEFLAHPIDATEVFRAVSRRFGVPVRQHPRYAVSIEVRRADGVLLGLTRNVSAGGLSFVSPVPQKTGDSLLLHLMLGDAQPTMVRYRILGTISEAQGEHVVRGQFENLRGSSLQQLIAFLAQHSTPSAE